MAFDKDDYWDNRNNTGTAEIAGKKVVVPRRLRGQEGLYIDRRGIVTGHHHEPDWPKKPVTKKARLKHTKRARKEELNGG